MNQASKLQRFTETKRRFRTNRFREPILKMGFISKKSYFPPAPPRAPSGKIFSKAIYFQPAKTTTKPLPHTQQKQRYCVFLDSET